ncbi:oxamate carbamoyltransferase subunit AllG family protein [Nocardioides terrisoli]|uniref:oxamate carbamoyltransferase subunit AllG family protein n=1 Tax=Nocardioides terrisoli TaxID=3388267 RepID=UPI00287B90D9|nr:DUF1116 domain-containing protein [Nocardioides marmorisolisilvae]
MKHRDAEIERLVTGPLVPKDEIQHLAASAVHLKGIVRAGAVWPELECGTSFLHAGPPLGDREPRAAMKGAVMALLLAQGVAGNVNEAHALVDDGALSLRPCHEVSAVGAMAGVVGAATPVVVVEAANGMRGYAPMNEGLGSALRFGDFDPTTIDRLRYLTTVVAPALSRAIQAADPIDVVELQADALRRADEGHNRNVAATSMLATILAPHLIEANDSVQGEAAARELRDNGHFFLAPSMAAAKVLADGLHARGPRGIVTAIASNGHSTGIRVSGTRGWFERPARIEVFQPLHGMDRRDADHPVGDSSVVETIGLGAMALSAAPGLARAMGWSLEQAQAHVGQMYAICETTSPRYTIPTRNFEPAPLGISVAKVLETGILPAFTTGFSHTELGHGRVGFGMVRVDRGAFEDAAAALAGKTVAGVDHA